MKVRVVAILEDDPRRVGEMTRQLGLVSASAVFFSSASAMKAWLDDSTTPPITVMSLDHDLNLGPEPDETGFDVIENIRKLNGRPLIVIHSSNEERAERMYWQLKEDGVRVHRVYPQGDLDWISRDWIDTILGELQGD